MSIETVDLENLCADLVSERDAEPFVDAIFSGERGVWRSVKAVCRDCHVKGTKYEKVPTSLFVAWLQDPAGGSDSATIVFFDDDSKWTLGAQIFTKS